MEFDRKEFTAAVQDLQKALASLSAASLNASEGDLATRFEAVDEARRKAANLLPSLRQTEMGFASFFEEIGNAVADAQDALDTKSKSYLDKIAKDKEGYLTPTVYRIPRVSAEMKFSLEKVAGKKLGVVFYSEKTEAKQMHNQSVQFEIVAVPPPPEYIAKLTKDAGGGSSKPGVRAVPRSALAAPPRPEPLVESRLEASTRQKVFAQIEAFRAETATEKRMLKKDLLLEQRERVLIFADEDHDTYFLVLATAGKNRDLLLWQLVREPSSFELIYHWPRTAKDRAPLESLHRYLVELGDQQQG